MTIAALTLCFAAAGPAFPAEPLAEQPRSTIGYPTAEAALAALHAKPGVEFSTRAGWTVASDPDTNSVWTFPPQNDPAYPAVVRRQAAPGPNGAVSVHTDVLCAASKRACDDLVRAFEQMTDEANAQAQDGQGGGVGAGE